MSEKEAIGPGSDKTKPMVFSGTEGVVTKRTEYQVNLEVSLKLKSALIARGYDVYMIRETNDVSLSNKKRALMANESGSDILLRIHCNSADSQSANGALTMSPTLSNPYCRSIAADSQELSECVVSTLCRRTGAVNRGVTQTDEMTGINWSKIPVTIRLRWDLCQNPEEDQKLSDNHYQSMLAEGIADGVDRYYERKRRRERRKMNYRDHRITCDRSTCRAGDYQDPGLLFHRKRL